LALKLENEFVVTSPVEPTWKTLLNLERVAGCLPGATIEPGEEEGTYNGSMRVKLGPVSMNYKGTARLESVDGSAYTAVFAVQGKETRGQGSAMATIRNQLVEENGSTRVLVETELSVTGRPAQFGRGIMQDVAASILSDFAKRLSEMMAADGAQDSETATSAPMAMTSEESKALEVGGALGRVIVGRIRAFFAGLFGRR